MFAPQVNYIHPRRWVLPQPLLLKVENPQGSTLATTFVFYFPLIVYTDNQPTSLFSHDITAHCSFYYSIAYQAKATDKDHKSSVFHLMPI